jgi:4-amino-4-deoxy-L-arabinose transferase-like glycosyltransferase
LAGPVAYQAAWPARRAPRLGLLATSVILCLWTAFNVVQDEGWVVDVTWVLSLVLLAGSVFYLTEWEWPRPAAVAVWLKKRRWDIVALVGIGAVSLGLGLYDLEVHPWAVANDESEYGVAALQILSGVQKNLFDMTYGVVPAWSVLTRALAIRVWGNTVFGLRFTPAVDGAVTAMLLYLLGRELFDRKIALLAVGVLITLPWQLQFSRLALGNSALFLFATLLVWLTFRALRMGRLIDYLWVGLASGGTLYCYAGTRALIGLPVGILGFVALRQRDYLRQHVVHLMVAGLTLVMTILPVVFLFWHFPNLLGAQYESHAILNGWLQNEATLRPGGYLGVLFEQFRLTAEVYFVHSSGSFFFQSPQPYLTALGGIFFVLGIGYAAGHWKEPRYMALVGWLAAALITGTLTDLAPASERLILSSSAVALLVAVGVYQVADLVRQAFGVSPALRNVVCAAVVAVLAVQGLTFYFIDYRIHNYDDDPGHDICYASSQYAALLGPNYRMYLIGDGAPQVLADFATFHYLAPVAHTTDFNTVTPDTVAALPADLGAFFVAVPSRQGDMAKISRMIPNGNWFQVERKFHVDQISYYGYVVSPLAMADR